MHGTVVTVSVVVVNKGDRGLGATLGALGGVPDARVLEVIVVDASAGGLDDIRVQFPAATWIDFEPREKQVTIAEQRNAGTLRARGDVVVFLDSSCVPDAGWLEHLLAPITTEGESVVAGAVRSSGRPGLRDEDLHFRGGARHLEDAPTINLALTRGVLDQVGPFDERFDYGSDVDFSWRAIDQGYRIRHEPRAIVSHDWGGPREHARRAFRYGQARARLYAKHRGRRRGVVRADPIAVVYPLVLLAAPVLVRRPRLGAVVLAVPLLRNARHRPLLTLADHLIYGCGVLTEIARRGLGAQRSF